MSSMSGYTKLFNSILASTVWREPTATRIVWITLLAMADKDGIAEASIPGLSDFARISIPETREALERLMAPDPDSRSKEFDGRRIEAVDGGWQILNHAKYRAKMGADERREYNRLKQAKYRERYRLSMTVNENVPCVDNTEAKADTDTKAIKIKGFIPPSLQEVIEYAKARNSKVDAVKFWNYYESNGWMVGRNKMKNWHAAFAKWERDVPEHGKKSDWLPPQNVSPSYVPESVKRKKELEQARLAGL